MKSSRRRFLRDSTLLAAALSWKTQRQAALAAPAAIIIDPQPLFDISPYLYMQFMEPLGTTDGSVEAAWDYDADDWRRDLVDTVKDLAPDVIRFGGLFCRYYKWREGVGPVAARPTMRNYVWGGKESNRVGTHEFVDFCRRVGAEPLYCVNFLSDGRRQYWKTREGNRSGDTQEAADWVSYANDPDSRERKAHRVHQPYNIKLWQLGNETSYDDGFTKDEAIDQTIAFAKAMKARDPSIQLIGWGDRGWGKDSSYWADDLLKRAGEHIDYVAFHTMGQQLRRPDTVLRGRRYEERPEQAWEELMGLADNIETRLSECQQVVSSQSSRTGIAITEGHLSLRPHNANPILYEWLTGVFHARVMNIFQRHGARVKIATAADFCGTRWTVNAVMMQVPAGISYLMPVGSVMRLFKRCNGKQAVAVKSAPTDLDIAASRKGNRLFLHVANMNYDRSREVTLAVEGVTVTGGDVYDIAPGNLRQYVSDEEPDVFSPKRNALVVSPAPTWRFPAGSVSVLELELQGEA
jgi:alpha-L-arabinofuranosidase